MGAAVAGKTGDVCLTGGNGRQILARLVSKGEARTWGSDGPDCSRLPRDNLRERKLTKPP